MSNLTELITYNQNDIRGILQICNNLKEYDDEVGFDNFVRIYGKNKIINILNARGFSLYNIPPQPTGGIIDKISRETINKSSNRNLSLTTLYSPYCYVKYANNFANNIMEEQKFQILFVCLTDNTAVDIKRKFTVEQLKNEIGKNNVILLNVKEKQIANKSIYVDDLVQIDKSYIGKAENGFLQKNIFPSIKFFDNNDIMQNIHAFESKNENLPAEQLKVKKCMAKVVLEYEAENQQIVLSNTIETMKKNIETQVFNYQKSQEKLSKLLSLNQQLLESLSSKKIESADFDLNENLKKTDRAN